MNITDVQDTTHSHIADPRLREGSVFLQEAYARERKIASVLQQSLLRLQAEGNRFPSLQLEAFQEAAWSESLIGGDFYDAFGLEDGFVALVVGDVCGKGLAAAAHIPEVRYALRAFLCERPDPAQALERVNRFLYGQKQGPEQFVALSLVVVDSLTGDAVSVAAGAEPPLVFRAQGGVERLPAGQVPLGIVWDQKYSAMHFCLLPGDILMMLTDGLTELRQGRTGQGQEGRRAFLGQEGLVALARQAVAANFAQQSTLRQSGQAAWDQAKAFCGGGFHDDVCLLLMQRQQPERPTIQ